jgi:PEP-CTERM motif-containing protein
VAASDLVIRQLDNVNLSGPDGPNFGTVLVATRGSFGGGPLPERCPIQDSAVVPATLPTIVPEPSTLALIFVGLLLFAGTILYRSLWLRANLR